MVFSTHIMKITIIVIYKSNQEIEIYNKKSVLKIIVYIFFLKIIILYIGNKISISHLPCVQISNKFIQS